MRLPRDLSGVELARLLHRYGYQISRQTGSHVRLTSTIKGGERLITVPAHKELKVETLNAILLSVGVPFVGNRSGTIARIF